MDIKDIEMKKAEVEVEVEVEAKIDEIIPRIIQVIKKSKIINMKTDIITVKANIKIIVQIAIIKVIVISIIPTKEVILIIKIIIIIINIK